jgi:hypothetical protein
VAALCAPWTVCAGQGGTGGVGRPLNSIVRPLVTGSASATFSERDAVRRYLLLMHELGIRVDLVARACDGRLSLSPPYAREYCYLQFRRVCELIALGCLQLHGDLPIVQTSAARKEWNAERIMRLLQKQHPHSFPQSVTRTKVGNVWKLHANSKPNALTFSEFKTLYAKCGELLHRGTIRTIESEAQIEKPEYDEVVNWSRKIVDLLNEHVVARAGGKSMYHISLKTEKGGPACSVFSNFQDGGVQVATYDLDVSQ